MSNYIHPMQDTYNKKVSTILASISNLLIDFDVFIKILRQHQIKFYSKDDLTKLTKLYVPSVKINIREAFIHLQLIYVHVIMQIKYFVVKFRGRSIPALVFKAFDTKKVANIHNIQHCVEYFKTKMAKINGKEGFWFKALGGISGTNFIKKDVFERKITKLFTNTCHSSCISRFIDFMMEDTASINLTWDHFRKKIIINVQQQLAEVLLASQPEKKKQQISGIRIKTFEIEGPKLPNLQLSQSQHLRSSTQGHKNEQRPRRRLKTIHDRLKIIETEPQNGQNLKLSMGPLVDQIIHSKTKVKYRLGIFKRSKSSIGGY